LTTGALEQPGRARADRRRPLSSAWAAAERNALAVLAFGCFAALLATQVGAMLSTDGWLSLVSGRLIAQHGLPWHDTLTALLHGRRWVDQQWLAQLTLYGLERLGGTQLLTTVNVILTLCAFAAAALLARRRGASDTVVAAVALVASIPLIATASTVKPQSLCYVLWVGLLASLGGDRRRARHWIGVAAILALWANLHGSVLLAAALVSVRLGLDATRRRSAARWLAVPAPWAFVFASPYAPGLVHYYGTTVLNRGFSRYLAQWAPTSFTGIALPVFGLVFGGLYLVARKPGAFTRFETAALILSMLAALMAVRNWPWLCLAAIAFAPKLVAGANHPRQGHGPARAGALVVGLGLVAALPFAFSRLGAAQARLYPAAAATRAAAAAMPGHRHVWASARLADWLLWRRPELAGAVVADARYELLNGDELENLVLFRYGGAVRWTTSRARVFVLDPTTDARALDALRPDVRVVYRSPHALVAVAR